jgi:hypothetical protein
MDVDWKFICLRMVNEERDYSKDRPGYERGHMRGQELLRVAAAVRDTVGRDAMLPLYHAYADVLHLQGDRERFDDPAAIRQVLESLGHPVDLADAADETTYDDVIHAETQQALDRCGGNIGTPVLTFSPPDGPSFFGPVINKAPKGAEALELWDAVWTLGNNAHFSELKRSTRGRPDFVDGS